MYLVVNELGLAGTGDFWHARGALPVLALNSVLEEFRGWTQPTLMLVGNHDQACCPCRRSLFTACLSGASCIIKLKVISAKGSAGSLGERINTTSAAEEKRNAQEDVRQQSKAARNA